VERKIGAPGTVSDLRTGTKTMRKSIFLGPRLDLILKVGPRAMLLLTQYFPKFFD
jgi:hypothetical protein